MAAPVLASVGTLVGGNANSGTTQDFAKPSGVANGDLLLAIYSVEHNASGTLLSAPSGWTKAPDSDGANQLVANGTALYVFWKAVTDAGSEPANYAMPVQTGRWRRGAILRITGADTTSPFDGGDGAVLASSSSTPAVSVTTAGVDRLCIWAAASYNLSAWANTPSGFTTLGEWVTTSEVCTCAQRTVATSGTAVGAAVATGATLGKAAWVGAIKPVATIPAPGAVFDLTDWKVTLPTDGPDSGTNADEITQPALNTYTDTNFQLNGSNQLVMTAPVQGATTSGSGGTRCEFREMEGGNEADWTLAGSGFRQLTVSGIFDPTSITDRKEMIVGQIHGETGTPPWYLAVEHHVATPRLRVYKDGPGLANVLTGLTSTTLITYRVRVYQGRVKMWAAIGAVAALPATPAFDWAAGEFTDATGCYLKVGAYNKSEVATGGTGSAIATITFLELIQPGDPIPSDSPEPGRFLLAY